MKKLWGGRFRRPPSGAFEALNSSIALDRRWIREDIAGSIAHARMLRAIRLLSASEARAIERGLKAIRRDVERGRLRVNPAAEDIHTFVETELTRRVGPAGGKLHTARSRNDQVALDLRLYLRAAIQSTQEKLRAFLAAWLPLAKRHAHTVMPAYTHLQRAQPVSAGHHVLAYVEMFWRDHARLADALARMNLSPLGAGACTGTGFAIRPKRVAAALQFDGVLRNSLDAVAARDHVIEFLAAAANLGVTLSRWAEEIILWTTREFGFATLGDAVSSGSSIMPQKRNPDAAELIRAKSARLIANLNALLIVVKGLPLAYNKDLQEDKPALFDSVDTLALCLDAARAIARNITLHPRRMRAAAAGGFSDATALADYLVRQGLPFREAHEKVGRMVRLAEQRGLDRVGELTLAQLRHFDARIGNDVFKSLSLEAIIGCRRHTGGTAPANVLREFKRWQKQLRT